MTIPRPLHGLAPALLAGLLVAGCAARPPAPADPLIGRIVEGESGAALERAALIERMGEAEVVYLGEVHDNPHHQARQREVLDALLEAGHRPALAIEFFGTEQTGWLMNFVQPKRSTDDEAAEALAVRALRSRVGWDGEEDDRWSRYGPLLRAAREHRLPAYGIDLPPALRLRLQRVGLEGLTPVERAQLPDTSPDPEAYAGVMNDRLGQAHCGFGTPESIARLYDTWLARNDAMAATVVDALRDPDHRPVLVVLGAGHVEHGQSVVRRVAELRPGTGQLAVGLRPVSDPPVPLEEHLEPLVHDGVDFGPDYEVFWFTPLQEREDLCEAYREILRERHGEKRPADDSA
ncbi:MAG: ChaN family lipoprotein [Gammaproteobacteria bacterium]|nr:ChaN family lipoprotein [Gammaproteobacteria bacterium]